MSALKRPQAMVYTFWAPGLARHVTVLGSHPNLVSATLKAHYPGQPLEFRLCRTATAKDFLPLRTDLTAIPNVDVTA